MVRKCIICKGPTGSREHIFPAALGGRRTNKGIYCAYHNNAYSDLVDMISEQLSVFNAQLGVVGDNSGEPSSVTMTEVASGREIELTSSQVRFGAPQMISDEVSDGKIVAQMSFNNQKEADDWVHEQRTIETTVRIVGKPRKIDYHIGTVRKEVKLGHTEEGLRAIAYIAQTFLAHSFPEIARLAELQGTKDYTPNNVGTGFVWWEFEPPTDLPSNSFLFGHRVIVGLNSEDLTAYARVSFFSALDFAILLGNVPVEASRAVITDIDPLAKSPPDDIVTWSVGAATGAVSRPNHLSAGLAAAIHTGRAEAQIHELMRRITDFERETAAAKIMKKIGGAAALPDAERDALFARVVSVEAQRVLNLMSYVAKDLKQRGANPVERAMAAFMQQVVKLDPTAENGLSAEAARSLAIACDALAKQMSEDCKAGTLDQDRMSMLIGGGPRSARSRCRAHGRVRAALPFSVKRNFGISAVPHWASLPLEA